MSRGDTITVSVAGLLAFLALVALVRVVLVRERAGWRRIRVGVFIERDHVSDSSDEDSREQ